MGRHTTIADAHILLCRDGQVLVGRRQNTGFGDGKLNPPGGHLEPGESLRDCARREAREELDVVIEPDQLRLAHIMHKGGEGTRICSFFITTAWEGEPRNAEPEKCSELLWVPVDTTSDDLLDYSRVALDCVARSVSYSEYGWE